MTYVYNIQADGDKATATKINALSKQLGRVDDVGLYPIFVRTSTSADLSGGATTLIAFHSEVACTLYQATLLYTEASSVDAGVTLKIGKETDDDYYYTGTSEASKAQWYSLNVTLLKTDLAAGDTILFYSAGGKAGVGEIMLILRLQLTE